MKTKKEPRFISITFDNGITFVFKNNWDNLFKVRDLIIRYGM